MGKLATGTTITVSPVTSANYGAPVTLTGTLAPIVAGTAHASGTIAFTDNTVSLGTAAPLSGATASTTLIAPAVGGHSYIAAYSGDANFTASSSTASAFTVNQATSATTATAIAPTYGTGATTTITVSGQFAGAGISMPTGIVNASVDGGTAQALTLAGGQVTFGTIVDSWGRGAQHRLQLPGEHKLPDQQFHAQLHGCSSCAEYYLYAARDAGCLRCNAGHAGGYR